MSWVCLQSVARLDWGLQREKRVGPVDRPAVALWRHFPGDDARPDDLAAAHIWWQRT